MTDKCDMCEKIMDKGWYYMEKGVRTMDNCVCTKCWFDKVTEGV